MPQPGVAFLTLAAGFFPGCWGARPEVFWRAGEAIGCDLPRLTVDSPITTEGRGSFSARCEPHPGKRVVLVVVNVEFFEMFKNWLGYAQSFLSQKTEHLHVVAEQEGVVGNLSTLLHGRGLDYTLDTPSSFNAPWGTKEYGKIVLKTPDRILDLVEKGCTVLYADIDAVWRKDPFHDISAAGDGDVYLTDNRPPRKNFCGCFIYAQASCGAQILLRSWVTLKEGCHHNQEPFNDAIQAEKDRFHLKVLPARNFPPGKVPRVILGSGKNATVRHVNFHIGYENKVEALRKLGLWHPEAADE